MNTVFKIADPSKPLPSLADLLAQDADGDHASGESLVTVSWALLGDRLPELEDDEEPEEYEAIEIAFGACTMETGAPAEAPPPFAPRQLGPDANPLADCFGEAPTPYSLILWDVESTGDGAWSASLQSGLGDGEAARPWREALELVTSGAQPLVDMVAHAPASAPTKPDDEDSVAPAEEAQAPSEIQDADHPIARDDSIALDDSGASEDVLTADPAEDDALEEDHHDDDHENDDHRAGDYAGGPDQSGGGLKADLEDEPDAQLQDTSETETPTDDHQLAEEEQSLTHANGHGARAMTGNQLPVRVLPSDGPQDTGSEEERRPTIGELRAQGRKKGKGMAQRFAAQGMAEMLDDGAQGPSTAPKDRDSFASPRSGGYGPASRSAGPGEVDVILSNIRNDLLLDENLLTIEHDDEEEEGDRAGGNAGDPQPEDLIARSDAGSHIEETEDGKEAEIASPLAARLAGIDHADSTPLYCAGKKDDKKRRLAVGRYMDQVYDEWLQGGPSS